MPDNDVKRPPRQIPDIDPPVNLHAFCDGEALGVAEDAAHPLPVIVLPRRVTVAGGDFEYRDMQLGGPRTGSARIATLRALNGDFDVIDPPTLGPFGSHPSGLLPFGQRPDPFRVFSDLFGRGSTDSRFNLNLSPRGGPLQDERLGDRRFILRRPALQRPASQDFFVTPDIGDLTVSNPKQVNAPLPAGTAGAGADAPPNPSPSGTATGKPPGETVLPSVPLPPVTASTGEKAPEKPATPQSEPAIAPTEAAPKKKGMTDDWMKLGLEIGLVTMAGMIGTAIGTPILGAVFSAAASGLFSYFTARDENGKVDWTRVGLGAALGLAPFGIGKIFGRLLPGLISAPLGWLGRGLQSCTRATWLFNPLGKCFSGVKAGFDWCVRQIGRIPQALNLFRPIRGAVLGATYGFSKEYGMTRYDGGTHQEAFDNAIYAGKVGLVAGGLTGAIPASTSAAWSALPTLGKWAVGGVAIAGGGTFAGIKIAQNFNSDEPDCFGKGFGRCAEGGWARVENFGAWYRSDSGPGRAFDNKSSDIYKGVCLIGR